MKEIDIKAALKIIELLDDVPLERTHGNTELFTKPVFETYLRRLKNKSSLRYFSDPDDSGGNRNMIAIAFHGEMSHKGFWLHDDFEWVIVKEYGNTILVPLPKKNKTIRIESPEVLDFDNLLGK